MRRIADQWITVAWLIGIACASGCQTVSITRLDRHTNPTSNKPLGPTAGWPDSQPGPTLDGTVTSLDPLPDPVVKNPDDLLTHADANRRAGVSSVGTSREVAARFELTAVAEAIEALDAARSAPSSRLDDSQAPLARGVYQAALRDFLRDSSGRRVQLNRSWEKKLASQGIRVQFDAEASTYHPDQFDDFLFADDYAIKGIGHEYKYEGLGVPLVGVKLYRPGDLTARKGEAKFLMPTQVYAVTAVLKPRGKGNQGDGVELAAFRDDKRAVPAVIPPPPRGDYVLELHDPLIERKVEFEGRSEPLAGDLTTSLTYHFVHSPLPLLQEIGLLDPQALERLAGLYMLHAYIPGKIPIILVHGLRSSPAAWLKVMNEVRGDPDLRDRYQIWLFMYPTGTPFPYSAAKLRSQMNELRNVVDPEHTDKALDRSVLIGHSMGGLITRLMISASGDSMWNLVGRRPFDELKASPERKEMLRNVFFFEPHPMVERAVFIATPHRGSELGDEFVGRLADHLIRIPRSLRSTYRSLMIQNGREFFTPEVRSGMPSSIDELRRDNRLLMTMDKLPTRPGLEAHSVIGRKDPTTPIEESTDGVVPYGSSHISWAVSEKVVTGDHGCQDTPDTIVELKRILNLHLGVYSGNLDDAEVKRASITDARVVGPMSPTPRVRAHRVIPPRTAAAPSDQNPPSSETEPETKTVAPARASWRPVRP